MVWVITQRSIYSGTLTSKSLKTYSVVTIPQNLLRVPSSFEGEALVGRVVESLEYVSWKKPMVSVSYRSEVCVLLVYGTKASLAFIFDMNVGMPQCQQYQFVLAVLVLWHAYIPVYVRIALRQTKIN